jgi:hypothetical protein
MKMGWGQAIRLCFKSKEEMGLVSKLTKSAFGLAARFGIYTIPVTFFDDALTPVPGIDLLTGSDDVLLVFGIIMFIRVAVFRHQKNRQLKEAHARHARAAYQG